MLKRGNECSIAIVVVVSVFEGSSSELLLLTLALSVLPQQFQDRRLTVVGAGVVDWFPQAGSSSSGGSSGGSGGSGRTRLQCSVFVVFSILFSAFIYWLLDRLLCCVDLP